MCRLLNDRKRQLLDEDAANDRLAERLHVAYRNTIGDGWETLVERKRELYPDRRMPSKTSPTPGSRRDRPRASRTRLGVMLASVVLVIGISVVLFQLMDRPGGEWVVEPTPTLPIRGGDAEYVFTDRLLDTEDVVVPEGKYSENISPRLALRMEIAGDEDVGFYVRYVLRKPDGRLVVGIAVLSRETILEMASLGYKLTDQCPFR